MRQSTFYCVFVLELGISMYSNCWTSWSPSRAYKGILTNQMSWNCCDNQSHFQIAAQEKFQLLWIVWPFNPVEPVQLRFERNIIQKPKISNYNWDYLH